MRARNFSKYVIVAAAIGSMVSVPRAAVAQPCSPHWDNAIAQPGVSDPVAALVVYDDGFGGGPALYAGGPFASAGGQSVNGIAKWNGSQWSPLGSGLSGVAAQVLALAVFDDGNGPLLYVGGRFTSAGGQPVTHIAKWNGIQWSGVGTALNGFVYGLTVFDDGTGPALYAGGLFTIAGGQSVNHIAKWNGTQWSPVGSGEFSAENVVALTVFDDGTGPALFVGGDFTMMGGVSAIRIAKWNGSQWSALGFGVGGSVGALTVFDDGAGPVLYVGGSFTTANTDPANRIAKWNGSQWSTVGSGMNDAVKTLCTFDDGTGVALYAGGHFTTAGGLPASKVAKWNGTQWSALGSGVTSTNVSAIAVFDDGTADGPALYAGGVFSIAGGLPSFYIARWVGCPYQWTNPVTGTFNVASNWANGLAPNASNLVLFGQTSSNTVFDVTLDEDAASQGLRITKQRPQFLLNGFTYAASNYVSIGEDQIGVLRLSNGSLVSPRIAVEPRGSLLADANIEGKLTNNGLVQPGLPSGTLNLNGNYVQQTGGVFRASIGANDFDSMNVSGIAQIGGTIEIQLRGGADPQPGESFTVMTASEITGTFAAQLLPDLGPDRVMQVQGGGTEGSGIVIIVGQPNGSPEFDEPATFTLEGEPTGVTQAAVSGLPVARDLALSVAALLPTDPGNALILLNLGDGSAFDPVVKPVGREPSGIVAANLSDAGGDNDFAVPNKGDDNVTVLFHDGGEDFTPLTMPVGNAPSAIAAADFNNDTFIDLAVTNELDNTVTLLFNNGDRTFTPQAPMPVGDSPSAISVAEIDGLPGIDIIVANAVGGTVTIFRNLGGGGFGNATTHPTGVTPSSVDPADLDNDKDVDLVAGCSGGGNVALLINSGGGNFAAAVNLPLGGNPAQTSGALTHWDMDADDDNDLVVVVDDDQLGPVTRILRNESTPSQIAFTLFNPDDQGGDPRLVTGADVTGDLADDRITVHVQQLPLAGPPSASLSIRPNISGKEPNEPGDINGDGHVNLTDLLIVIGHWGPCPPPCPADVFPHPGGNGTVNLQDLLFVIANWG